MANKKIFLFMAKNGEMAKFWRNGERWRNGENGEMAKKFDIS